MNCPNCHHKNSIVIKTFTFSQSRERYRLCKKCLAVFSTVEKITDSKIVFKQKKQRISKKMFFRGNHR